jgi:hypothetical protein
MKPTDICCSSSSVAVRRHARHAEFHGYWAGESHRFTTSLAYIAHTINKYRPSQTAASSSALTVCPLFAPQQGSYGWGDCLSPSPTRSAGPSPRYVASSEPRERSQLRGWVWLGCSSLRTVACVLLANELAAVASADTRGLHTPNGTHGWHQLHEHRMPYILTMADGLRKVGSPMQPT